MVVRVPLRVVGVGRVAAVEREEGGLFARKMGGHAGEVGVDGEVGEAPPVREERLLRVAVFPVLPDCVLHGLAGERVLEFGGEDGDAVDEDGEVEGLLRPGGEVELADDREDVLLVEVPVRLVEAGVGLEVGEVEDAAEVADALFKDVDGAPLLDLGPDAAEELPAGPGPPLLLELLPFGGLGGVDEAAEVGGDEAEVAVVVGAGAEAVA